MQWLVEVQNETQARRECASNVLDFALPALLAASPWAWWLAVLAQVRGLVADRWVFFAQAKHPQNPYYQDVS